MQHQLESPWVFVSGGDSLSAGHCFLLTLVQADTPVREGLSHLPPWSLGKGLFTHPAGKPVPCWPNSCGGHSGHPATPVEVQVHPWCFSHTSSPALWSNTPTSQSATSPEREVSFLFTDSYSKHFLKLFLILSHFGGFFFPHRIIYITVIWMFLKGHIKPSHPFPSGREQQGPGSSRSCYETSPWQTEDPAAGFSVTHLNVKDIGHSEHDPNSVICHRISVSHLYSPLPT